MKEREGRREKGVRKGRWGKEEGRRKRAFLIELFYLSISFFIIIIIIIIFFLGMLWILFLILLPQEEGEEEEEEEEEGEEEEGVGRRRIKMVCKKNTNTNKQTNKIYNDKIHTTKQNHM